jgi:hypothetical protein
VSPRTYIITENAFYLVMYAKVKGEIVTKLDRCILLNSITGFTFSPFGDDFIIVHTLEEGDTVIECTFKTEILAWICSKNPAASSNIKYEDKVKYLAKKKKVKITFLESPLPEHLEGLYKNGKFYTPPALPQDSRPTELTKKQGDAVLTNRPLPTPGTGASRMPNQGGRPLPPTSLPGVPPGQNSRPLPPSNQPPPPQQNLPKCQALYNYTAQENDELTLRKGDIITIVKEHPDWWEGELNGRVGVFPANYVQKM